MRIKNFIHEWFDQSYPAERHMLSLVGICLALVMLIELCGCTSPDVSDPTHNITWTSPITCTDVIDHPCPYITTATLLTFNTLANTSEVGKRNQEDRVALTWWGSSAATDDGPVEGLASYTLSGDIQLSQAGDGAGERMAATLHRNSQGYEGDVSWLLFTVPGVTVFHLSVERGDTLEVGQ